jgi:hypothetical protein
MAIAVTSSGEVTNAWVFGLPSFRLEKFRLNECTMVFFSFFIGTWSCPLTDAGSTGIGKNLSSHLFKNIDIAISFNGISYHFRAGSYCKFRFGL